MNTAAPARRQSASKLRVHIPTEPAKGGNSLGRVFCLTLHTPIRRQWAPILGAALWIAKWIPFAQKHILQFNFIHFVRWTIVKEMPYNGAPQVRDKLNYPYLFFESNFDGPWQHYIDAFAYCIPFDIRFVWGRGVAFPGPPPAEPLKRWIAMNSMEGGTYYCAYPQASTRMVKSALILQPALAQLVADSKTLDAAAFKARYERFLTDVQGTPLMREKHNRTGSAYALTVFTAILPGHEEAVAELIENLPRGEASPIARLQRVHTSRLQIFDKLVYQGAPQIRDELKNSYLVFTAAFDGDANDFVDALATTIPTEAHSWWRHCVGYPGLEDRAAFRRWIEHNQLDTSLFGVASIGVNVQQVREALRIREQVIAFAIEAQGLDADALLKRFKETFTVETR